VRRWFPFLPRGARELRTPGATTDLEGCSVACTAPLSDTEASVATVPGWGLSVLMR